MNCSVYDSYAENPLYDSQKNLIFKKYNFRRILMSQQDWLAHKITLGFDFPNLPFYEVNGFSNQRNNKLKRSKVGFNK